MPIELIYDLNGCLPIHMRVAEGNVEATRQLLDHGYCSNVRTMPSDRAPYPIFPMCIAFGNADVPMMELLLERGAISCLNNPKCSSHYHPHAKFLQYMGRLIANSSTADKARYTNLIKKYLANGSTADLKFRLNDNGCTPVHYAALFNPHLLSNVIEMGFDIDAQTNDGDTALIMAMMNGDVKTVVALIKYGSDPNIVDKEGYNAYHYAKYHNIKLETGYI